MGVEQHRTARILQEARPKRRIVHGLDEAGKGFVRWFTENAAIAAPKEYHPDFADDIVNAAQDGFMQAYEGGPHTAWFDAILMSYITRVGVGLANEYLSNDERIKGAIMPFAKTLKTGRQGVWLDFMFQATLPILTRNGVYPVYTATENDVIKRGEPKNGREFMADMYAMAREGYSAMAVMPEGSVEAGRKDKDGKRIGMQLVREGTAASAIILAKRLRRQGVVYIPVATEGGWKVNNPHGKWPTPEGFKTGLLMTEDVCSVRVGKPIRSDDPEVAQLIKSRDWEQLDDMIGFAIANLASPDMRGVYTNTETLRQAKLRRAQARQTISALSQT